jgi:hypothetical protein
MKDKCKINEGRNKCWLGQEDRLSGDRGRRKSGCPMKAFYGALCGMAKGSTGRRGKEVLACRRGSHIYSSRHAKPVEEPFS